MHTIRTTQSLCPVCHERLPAELLERGEDVWIRRTCPQHGTAESLYWKDRRLFHDLSKLVGDYTWCTTFECLQGRSCDRCLEKTYNIMIEVTNRCNLDCPVCCSDANRPYSPDPTVQQILDRLPPAEDGFRGKLARPNVVLFGGEPTVRRDLPDLIRELVRRGYIPRLATNGTRMTDDRYLATLREAGLKWVVLQFDGFDDSVSTLLRGLPLQNRKMLAIEKMTAAGFHVQLGTMMVKGANTRYAGDLIRFVGRHPKIFWMSFYPHSAQSRYGLPTRETYTADMLDEIETHTQGRITRRDFVDTMRLMSWAHRVLRTPNLRQKLSTLPMMLVFDRDEYFPLSRFLHPGFALRHPRLVLKLLVALPRLLRYQEEASPPFIKFLVVEKFHADDSIDLEEASNCHMAFMTSKQYVPFDIYNIAVKKHGAWEVPDESLLRRVAV